MSLRRLWQEFQRAEQHAPARARPHARRRRAGRRDRRGRRGGGISFLGVLVTEVAQVVSQPWTRARRARPMLRKAHLVPSRRPRAPILTLATASTSSRCCHHLRAQAHAPSCRHYAALPRPSFTHDGLSHFGCRFSQKIQAAILFALYFVVYLFAIVASHCTLRITVLPPPFSHPRRHISRRFRSLLVFAPLTLLVSLFRLLGPCFALLELPFLFAVSLVHLRRRARRARRNAPQLVLPHLTFFLAHPFWVLVVRLFFFLLFFLHYLFSSFRPRRQGFMATPFPRHPKQQAFTRTAAIYHPPSHTHPHSHPHPHSTRPLIIGPLAHPLIRIPPQALRTSAHTFIYRTHARIAPHRIASAHYPIYPHAHLYISRAASHWLHGNIVVLVDIYPSPSTHLLYLYTVDGARADVEHAVLSLLTYLRPIYLPEPYIFH